MVIVPCGVTRSRLMNQMSSMADPRDEANRFIKFPAVPTKYTVYNSYSGAIVPGINGNSLLNGGLFPRLCNIIGESATGKTSFAIGSIASGVDHIWKTFGMGYSEFFFYDPENNTPDERFMNLSNWSPAEFVNKCNYSNESISLIDLANKIIMIHDIKTKYRKDYLLPSGIMDVDGREVLFLAPTYILIDSVAAVNPNGVESLIERNKAGEIKELDKLGNNMEAATDAKAWTIFVRKLKPMLDAANIGLYCVNHKTKDLSIDPYSKKTRYLPFLGMDEKIKGGKEFIFQSFNIFDFGFTERYDEKNPVYGDYMNGFRSTASFVKNKYNIEGAKFPMVFSQDRGYLPELSDMEYLYQNKIGLTGSIKMSLEVLPEITFTRKTLLDTIEEFPQLGRALKFTAKYYSIGHMVTKRKPISLVELGTNVGLDQRLSMIYSLTDSYDTRNDTTDEYLDFRNIAINNRHYVSVNLDRTYENMIIDNDLVNRTNKGYIPMLTDGVSPFDLEKTNVTNPNKEITSGAYCIDKKK